MTAERPTAHRADWTARRIVREADSLAREFAGTFSREEVFRLMQEATEALRDVPHAEYVPIPARRIARDRLRAAADGMG